MFNISKLKTLVFLFFSFNLVFNKSIPDNELSNFIFPEDINFTEYKEICKENIFYNHKKCFSFSEKYEKKIESLLLSVNIIKLNETNNEKISYIYYNLGNIYYHGHISKEPDLDKGLAYFIVSAYFGSPQSKYKLSIILSNGIFEQIYKGNNFQKLLNNFEMLKKISTTEFFIKNFQVLMIEYNNELNDNLVEQEKEIDLTRVKRIEEFKNNLAMSFLYSATLQNYFPAKKLLANRLNKGYGISYSCSSSIKYYIELSKDTLKEISESNTKLYFDYEKLDNYEYVGNKFEEDNIKDEKHIVDYYWYKINKKKEKNNLKIIKELAKIYYYGSAGVKQNYEISLDLYKRAESLNDTESLFYIGEHYLNGWGTEKNYTKALEYFKKSISYNNTENAKSWNSLGYLYYYGLGVEKDIEKARDYFNIGASYKDSAAILDSSYLLITNTKKEKKLLEKDYTKAYNHVSKLATLDYSFGTYFYAMMNQYSIGSSIKSCDINIKFFISICEKNIYIKYLYDLAIKYYKNKMYRKAFLLYLELAEGGSEAAQINAALLLNNYNIFKDKEFQKYLTYKYYYMSHLNGNSLASLKLGDLLQEGFGWLKKDIEKAKKYYKDSKSAEIITNAFKLSHADFNLGLLHLFNENSTNITDDIYQSELYFNSSSKLEELTYYPIKLAKLYFKLFYDEKSSIINLLKNFLYDYTIGCIFNKSTYISWQFIGTAVSIILYGLFYLSLKNQND